jgi:hypothetical protein
MLYATSRITIPPFIQRVDGDDVIIGIPERSCFLAIPPDAAALLQWLADGRTVGEAIALYEQQYAANPDVEEFLASLEEAGFLDNSAVSATQAGHFSGISVSAARRVCSWPVAAVGTIVVGAGVFASITQPAIVPGPNALVFEHNQLGLAIGVALTTLITVFFHELAHLVAARAANVPSRMGIGTRLWVLVAETDMSGIWLASRTQRCVAFFAGSALDAVMASALLLLVYANARSFISLDPTVVTLVRATIFVIFTRLLWQLYLFLPTDVYYVLTTLFGCKNLMRDTRAFLINQLARAVSQVRGIDQSDVPAHEMRVVHWFALVWLGGRIVAFASLFLITLPVLAGYAAMLGRGVGGDEQAMRPLLEGPPLVILAIVLQSFGLLAWLRSLVFNRRSV